MGSVSACRSPRPRARRRLPVRAAGRGGRRVAARGIEVIDFGMGDPREPTDPLIRAGARRRRSATGWATPAAVGLPELREAIAGLGAAALRRRARPGDGGHPDARHQGGDLLASRSRSSTRTAKRDTVAYTEPGYPVYERGALSRTRGRWRCRCSRSTASCRTSTRSTTRRGRAGRLLGQLPEQPDGRDRAARLLRAARRRSRASTASCSPPTRRTPSSGSTSRRRRRCSSPTGRTSSSSTRSRSARR